MGALVRIHTAAIKAFAVFAGVIIGGIAVVIPVEVALRALSLPSIYGVLDLVQYGLLAATFLAAPWVLMLDAHVTVDLATMLLTPRMRLALFRATCAVGALVSAVLCMVGIDAVLIAFARGSAVRTAFVVPEWIPLSALPVAAALLAIEFVLKLTGVRRPHSRSRAGL